MAYRGGRLRPAPWFSTRPNDRFIRRAARAGGRRFVELAAMNTPVDTGHLRHSWRRKPVVVYVDGRGRPVAASGVETDVEYAPYVEWGTGLWGPKHAKYLIEPKKLGGWLRWIDPQTGDPVFAKRVMHPGSPGNHMIAFAAGILEHEVPRLLLPELERWASEVERQNRTGLLAGRHA